MIILFMLFLIQFSIACSCLAVNHMQQREFAEQGWSLAPADIKQQVQEEFLCCGFNSTVADDHPSCAMVNVSVLLHYCVRKFHARKLLTEYFNYPRRSNAAPRVHLRYALAHRACPSWKVPSIMHSVCPEESDYSSASPRYVLQFPKSYGSILFWKLVLIIFDEVFVRKSIPVLETFLSSSVFIDFRSPYIIPLIFLNIISFHAGMDWLLKKINTAFFVNIFCVLLFAMNLWKPTLLGGSLSVSG